MPGEDLVLDADMGRITLELKKVQTEMRKTGKVWQAISSGANRDTKKNQDALKRLETGYGKAAAKAGDYKLQLDRLAKSSGNAAVRQKRLQSGMTQASFAMDDFLSVSSQQGFSMKGLAGGVRAASNNVSTFLTTINPMAGLAATLGIGVLTGLMTQFGKATEKSAEDTGKLREALKTLRKDNEEARLGSDDSAANVKLDVLQREIIKAKEIRDDKTVARVAAERVAADRKKATEGFAAGGPGAAPIRFTGDPRVALGAATKEERDAERILQGLRKERDTLANRLTKNKAIREFKERNAGAVAAITTRRQELGEQGLGAEAQVAGAFDGSGLAGQPGAAQFRANLVKEAQQQVSRRRSEAGFSKTPLEQKREEADESRRLVKQARQDARSQDSPGRGNVTGSEKRLIAGFEASAVRLERAAAALERAAEADPRNGANN